MLLVGPVIWYNITSRSCDMIQHYFSVLWYDTTLLLGPVIWYNITSRSCDMIQHYFSVLWYDTTLLLGPVIWYNITSRSCDMIQHYFSVLWYDTTLLLGPVIWYSITIHNSCCQPVWSDCGTCLWAKQKHHNDKVCTQLTTHQNINNVTPHLFTSAKVF